MEMNCARKLLLPSADKRPVKSIVGVGMEMVGACWLVPGLHVTGEVEAVTDIKVLYLHESETLAASLPTEKNEAHRYFASVASILRSVFGRYEYAPSLISIVSKGRISVRVWPLHSQIGSVRHSAGILPQTCVHDQH